MQGWWIMAASVVVLLVLGWIFYAQQRSKRLRERFGPAYDQTVSEIGNRRRAEAQLLSRETLARQLRSQSLDSSDRAKFLSQWKRCQALFVDDPAAAVDEANEVIVQLMRKRGYAADTVRERTKDIAAAYPQHAAGYAEASEIMERHRDSGVTTHNLRTAFLNYRDLFEDLIGGFDEQLQRAA